MKPKSVIAIYLVLSLFVLAVIIPSNLIKLSRSSQPRWSEDVFATGAQAG